MVNDIQAPEQFFNHTQSLTNKYGLIQKPENLAKYSNNGNIENLEKVENLRIKRSSSGYIKNLEKKCFICQELRNIESNHYNQGRLGRYQTDSSSQRIHEAKEYYLNNEN